MPLDPDNFNPYGSPDGTYAATVSEVNTTLRDGTPFVTQDDEPQIVLKLKLITNKTVNKYVTVGQDTSDLMRALKACGVKSEELKTVEPYHFLDKNFANQVFVGRTCEVTLKTVEGKDGRSSQRVYMDEMGARDAKEAKKAGALPAVAKYGQAPAQAPQGYRPVQQAPAAPPSPVSRWGNPPPPPRPNLPPIRQEPPPYPVDDGTGIPF